MTCYIAQTLPDLHEGDRDGYSDSSGDLPSWIFFSILALSIFVPLLIWRSAGKKNEKGFNDEGCITLGIGMLIVLMITANFAYGVGIKGIATLFLIALVIRLLVKALKKSRNGMIKNPVKDSPISPSIHQVKSERSEFHSRNGAVPIVLPTPHMRARSASLPIGNSGNPDIFNPKIGAAKAGAVGITLCGIEPGEFFMGSPAEEVGHRQNENLVKVKISTGFWMARTQCTQEQWGRVMGTNPSHFVDQRHPVEMISWEEANQFCAVLTKIQHDNGELPLEAKWSLPSEAQWEYACRAGSRTSLNNGKSIDLEKGNCQNLDEIAWYDGNSGGMTHPVAQKQPNNWGLYDMHGNVWEWCRDWYHFSHGGGEDPRNDQKGEYRSIRGGGWGDSPWACRSAARHQNPLPKDSDFGFRPIVCW